MNGSSAHEDGANIPQWARRSGREPSESVESALGRLGENTSRRCSVCGVQISDRRLRGTSTGDRCMNHLTDRSTPCNGVERAGPAEAGTEGTGDTGDDS